MRIGERFDALCERVFGALPSGEVALLGVAAETSDFVRLSRGRVRQAGSVDQAHLSIELAQGRRHAAATVALSGDVELDARRASDLCAELRPLLAELPEDPYFCFDTSSERHEQIAEPALAAREQALEAIFDAAGDRDLVGVYAAGPLFRGFASSTGRRLACESHSFNLDFSLHEDGGRAVKGSYAGYRFAAAELQRRVDDAAAKLALLARPAHDIKPGGYRVYLAPSATAELLGMLAWGGFGLKSWRTKQTPLLRLVEGERRLDPRVTLRELGRHAEEDGPGLEFDRFGYRKPESITLVRQGAIGEPLVSARSSAEFDATPTGSDANESPSSLELSAGELPSDEAAQRVGEGLYVGNLWYLNYSDRSACRVTGMTRFATFWVEGGRPVAPVAAMRFDESLYDALGDKLVGLTRERELLLDADTYGQRSSGSMRVPGLLVDDFTLTL